LKRRKYKESKEDVIVIDDTPLPKRGKMLPGIRKLYDSCGKKFYYGYEMVTVALSNGKKSVPVEFAIQAIGKRKKKRRKGRRKKGYVPRIKETKLKTALLLLEKAVANGIKAKIVVFDCWYTAVKLLKGINKLGLIFVAPVKRNRYVIWEGKRILVRALLRYAKRNGKYVFYVELPNYGKVKLFCIRMKFKKTGVKWNILITQDLEMSLKEIKKAYRKRWGIEVMFEEAKQRFGLLNFHNRKLSAIVAHICFSLIAYILVDTLRIVHSALKKLTLGKIKQKLIAVKVLVTIKMNRLTVGFTENALCLKLFRRNLICQIAG